MSLRDRIAKAVLDKILVMFTENDPVESASAYIADAILAIPGIAVVELPEPDYEDSTGHGWNGDPGGHYDPDQMPYWRSVDQVWQTVHGCCGCCRGVNGEDSSD